MIFSRFDIYLEIETSFNLLHCEQERVCLSQFLTFLWAVVNFVCPNSTAKARKSGLACFCIRFHEAGVTQYEDKKRYSDEKNIFYPNK